MKWLNHLLISVIALFKYKFKELYLLIIINKLRNDIILSLYLYHLELR